MQSEGVPYGALIPLFLFMFGFAAYCLFDLSRNEVRHLPKWAWALICVLSIPFGGIVYLLIGRQRR